MRKFLVVLTALAMTLALIVPAMAENTDKSEDTVILYTNDIHTYIDNSEGEGNDNGLTHSKVAALKACYDNALLVDAGDHIQGTAYGQMDCGETIIELMNATGYDLATLGNHEFDYDMDGCMQAIAWAQFPYVSCNFYHEENGVPGENVLDGAVNVLDYVAEDYMVLANYVRSFPVDGETGLPTISAGDGYDDVTGSGRISIITSGQSSDREPGSLPVGNGLSAPDAQMSRAMLVTTLWNLAGKPVVDYAMSFTDVAAESWYAEAVRWAASEGVVSGYDAETFAPDDRLTREQMATILYGYEKYKGGGFVGAWMFRLDYPDVADISDWAYEPMCWMTMKDIMGGKNGGLLDPKGTVTCAEVARSVKKISQLP